MPAREVQIAQRRGQGATEGFQWAGWPCLPGRGREAARRGRTEPGWGPLREGKRSKGPWESYFSSAKLRWVGNRNG